MSLSVIIITYNAANTLSKTLRSVAFADEIIVVDSGSTDNTRVIAKAYTDKVYQQAWLGFGPQKNLALSYAQGDWVLSLDADEWLSDTLQRNIQAAIKQNKIECFSIPIKLFFLQKLIRYANGSNKALRLFKRNSAVFSDDKVHEKIISDKPVGRLKNPIIHQSFNDIEHLLSKLNHYSTLSANKYQRLHKKGGVLRGVYHKWWLFFRIYVLNLGFLDGAAGFILSREFANASYYRYLKAAYQLSENKTHK